MLFYAALQSNDCCKILQVTFYNVLNPKESFRILGFGVRLSYRLYSTNSQDQAEMENDDVQF